MGIVVLVGCWLSCCLTDYLTGKYKQYDIMIVLNIELDIRILEHAPRVTHNERDVSIMEYSTHHEQYTFTIPYALHDYARGSHHIWASHTSITG